MGTTLTALQSGQASFTWVAAIYGFDYLFTSGEAAAAVTAWAGTGYSSAVSGLTVVGRWEQKLDPWDAFPQAGTLQLSIQPDSNDRTAPMFKSAPNVNDTLLTLDAGADDTTLTVQRTAGLSSPVFIGTERITFTGSTATTLTGCTRGTMSPFSTSAGDHKFGQVHRATTSSVTTQILPVVANDPRAWVGKWVGLWAHRTVDGVLDVKAEAHNVFAGRIVSVTDDAGTGCTVIEVEHVAEVVGKQVIGKETWSADVSEGFNVYEGDRLVWEDYDGAGGYIDSDPLVCVTGASGTNEFEPGLYTADAFCEVLSTWLQAELAAPRIHAEASFAAPFTTPEGLIRSRLRVVIDSASTADQVGWRLYIPDHIREALGFERQFADGMSGTSLGDRIEHYYSTQAPVLYSLRDSNGIGAVGSIELENIVGTFEDQFATLPAEYAGWADVEASGADWGVFRSGDYVFVAQHDAGTLRHCKTFTEISRGTEGATVDSIRMDAGVGRMSIRQIFVISGDWADLLVKVLASTGSTGYNHTDYDTLPAACGAAIPWSLIGDDFVSDCATLSGADAPMTLVLEKPISIREALGDDLIFRRAGLTFRNGTLRLAKWQTPNAASVTAALTEANKASPSDVEDENRSPTVIEGSAQRCTVKIEYNRRGLEDRYKDSITLQDRTAADDAGGDDKPATIKLRNTYADLSGLSTDAGDVMATSFLASMPLFSRPARLITRTIGLPHFETLSPGHVVTIADSFARDPLTGSRGVSAAKAFAVSTSYDYGGPSPGDADSVRPMGGEVTLMLVDGDRTRPYCPTAQVDDTQANAGYNAGTFALTCYAHAHSSILFAADASYFTAGDSVRIEEIDPATPSGGNSWTRTISTVVGNVITLTVALSAPAWDSAKKYRVTPNDFASAGVFVSNSYQADDADTLIIDTTVAHQYASTSQYAVRSAGDADLPERHSSNNFGDGKPYTTGAERAVMRGLNNIKRSLTRRQGSSHFDAPYESPATGTDYHMLAVKLINLRQQPGLVGAARRKLVVGPRFRSASGSSVTLRVTISLYPPASPNSSDPGINVQFSDPHRSTTWSTSSTSYSCPTAFEFDTAYTTPLGVAWLIVEGTDAAQFAGFQTLGETVAGQQYHDLSWCKNGDAPQAEVVASMMSRMTSTLRTDMKEVFSVHGTYDWPAGAVGNRTRWRHRFHTGIRTSRIAVAWLVAPSTIVTAASSAEYRLTDEVAATSQTLVATLGAVTNPKGNQVPVSECFFGISYLTVSPDTTYFGRFRDVGGARVVAASVFEMPSVFPEAYYAVSALAPILDVHREHLHETVTDALARNGAHLGTWNTDLATDRSTTSATSRNLIDDTSTTHTSTTPGFIPQIKNCTTVAQAGANVVFCAYAEKTSAGNGFVELLDDTGAVVLSITVTSGGGETWYEATGTLPPVDGKKYDVHYRRATGGTLTVKAVSLYLKG